MQIEEFNQFIKNIWEEFPTFPDYSHLMEMSDSELLLRIVGNLFNAHLSQNVNCPLIEEFNMNDETDDDSFYYDYQNHFDKTCEFYLIESFIEVCLFCKKINTLPKFTISREHDDVFDICQEIEEIDDEFDFSELILKTISIINYSEEWADSSALQINCIYELLLRIYQLIYVLEGDIEIFVEYQKKIEKIYE